MQIGSESWQTSQIRTERQEILSRRSVLISFGMTITVALYKFPLLFSKDSRKT